MADTVLVELPREDANQLVDWLGALSRGPGDPESIVLLYRQLCVAVNQVKS